VAERKVARQRIGRLGGDQQDRQPQDAGERDPRGRAHARQRDAGQRTRQRPGDEHPERRLAVEGGELEQRQ
jgi:hypothetical protein